MDLSPRNWKPEEKARAEQLEYALPQLPSEVRVFEGHSGLIAATLSPISILAGLEALKQGGTAADAAATIALTQVTTALGSYVSYAGVLQLLYYEAKSAKVYSLNAGWNSYLGETDPQTIPVDDLGPLPFSRKPTEGAEGRKTLVPGFMAGIEAMHKRFGRLPFPEVFQPAIFYAENGITISPLLAFYFQSREKFLSRTPEGRAFVNQAADGLPKAGDRFLQTDLAKTLRAVSEKGAHYMYTGAWGQQFVEAVQREGGKATMSDMKRYQPIWGEPHSTTFLGHTVFVPGKSNDGGYQVLEALNLAEELKLDQMGPYQKDPKAFRTLSRILGTAELDSVSPPQFADWKRQNGLSLSREDRITKPYAKALAAVMTGVPDQTQQRSPSSHTDAIVVVDRWGNIAALAHSINTVLWGTTGIVVGGIPIPDAAGFQQRRLAAIKPGDPVPDDMAPVIAMSGGKPALAIAAVGVSLMRETVRIVVGVFANGLSLQAVMAAPPLLLNTEAPKVGETASPRPERVPEGAYDPDFLKELQVSGMNTEPQSTLQVYTIRGTAVLAAIDPETGIWRSVETPGVFDFAAAY